MCHFSRRTNYLYLWAALTVNVYGYEIQDSDVGFTAGMDGFLL